jgi:hypothetical protein
MDIVMTAALGYEHSMILPFIKSLRKVYVGKIVCLINPGQLSDMQILEKEFSVEFLLVEGSRTGNPACDRFFTFQNYLDSNRDLKRVFLTDSRDVIFQESPFANSLPHLYFYAEPLNIENCRINSSWIRNAYGDNELEKLKTLPILCIGTVLGSYELMKDYLKILCEAMQSLTHPNKRLVWGEDQAAHMYLHYSGKFPHATIRKHGLSEVQTLCHEKTFSFDKDCFLLNLDGEKVRVIHQYDRHKQFYPIFSQMLNHKSIS